MRIIFWKAMTLTAFAVGMTCASFAQSAPSQPGDTARVEPPATPNPGGDTTHGSASAAQPELQPTVTQEIEALKSRIDQLENEVKEQNARALADSEETSELKTAEKELVGSNVNPAPVLHAAAQATTPPAAAVPATPLRRIFPPKSRRSPHRLPMRTGLGSTVTRATRMSRWRQSTLRRSFAQM